MSALLTVLGETAIYKCMYSILLQIMYAMVQRCCDSWWIILILKIFKTVPTLTEGSIIKTWGSPVHGLDTVKSPCMAASILPKWLTMNDLLHWAPTQMDAYVLNPYSLNPSSGGEVRQDQLQMLGNKQMATQIPLSQQM